MVKRIVILTFARSGASRLKQLFFRSFLGFPKLDTELFKTNNPSLKNFFIKNKHNLLPNTAHKYKKVLQNDDLRFEDPIECLNQLSNICYDLKYKYLLLKVTPNIFNFETIKRLANETNITFFFFTRNILDTYISYEKALKINKWNSVDTSNIILKLDESKFLKYHENYINWVKTTYSIIKSNNNINFYDYNDIYNTDNSDKKAFLNLFKTYINENDINYKYFESSELEIGEHRRQDKAKLWKNKISNSTSIESIVNNNNLELNAYSYLKNDN